jgi:hypothetical protein
VAGRIDDVNPGAAVFDRAVLGEDGDAALSLDGILIHDAIAHLLVGGEGPGLLQQAIDQRGLAMIDVGNDGDVSNRALHGLTGVVM